MLSFRAPREGVRRANRLFVSLALGAAAFLSSAVGLQIEDVAHAKPAPKVVAAPKAGQRLDSAPVRVTVRAAWKVRSLRVWLNGRSLSHEFRRAEIRRRSRRTVRVSASHGLRYGKNVIRVSKKRFARKRKRHRVRFTLTRERPLVGAGRDRRVHVGRSVRLNGRASRGRRAWRGKDKGTPAGLRMRWRLVQEPAASKAKLRRSRGRQPSDDELADQPKPIEQPARPRIKLDRPGRYVSKLVVIDSGVRSVADRVVTTALVGTPLVPVDTAATVCDADDPGCTAPDGTQGIAIGYHPAEQGGRAPQGPNERFFPLQGDDALQLIVLDRRTLETVASWSGSPSPEGVAALTARLKRYGDNRLAIVTAWQNAGWGMDDQATQRLVNTPGQGVNLIGAAPLAPQEIDAYGLQSGVGQLSWIGAPGFPAATAWAVGGVALPEVQQGQDLTSLQGFLSPDSNENYAYLGTSPTTYDLGPDGQSVSMTIGSESFSASLPAGQGGFLVAYLSQTTLKPVFAPKVPNGQVVYATRNADGSPNFGAIASMTRDLDAVAAAGERLLVAIRSIGPAPLARIGLQPPNYEGSYDARHGDAVNRLGDTIAGVGGTGQLVWGMATHPTGEDSYSLIGSNELGNAGRPYVPAEGWGADLGSQLKPHGQTRLSGILVRDKRSHYLPRVSANQPLGAELAQLSVAEPTAWPHSSTQGERAALVCIGKAQGLGPDPRVAYWLQTYSESRWLQTKQDVEQMQPSACPDVDAADFATVRDELVTEIGWLINVNSYIEALTQPFTSSGLSSFAELNSITEEVVQEVSPPSNAETGIDGLAIFADVLDILAEFEVPGAGAIAGTLFVLDDLTATGDDGPTIDWRQRVEAASANVGEELAGELKRIADGNEQLADIIAADYAKLSTVGRLGQCTPGDSGCTPEWQFTRPQQNAASRMYEITAKRQIWGGVLPAGYPFVLYTNSDPDSYGPSGSFQGPQDQISSIRCGAIQADVVFDVVTPTFLYYAITAWPHGIRALGNTPFMVFSQNNAHFFSGRLGGFPSPSLLAPLFAPLDPGGDPDTGGLGLDQYAFMIDNWQTPPLAGGGPTRALWVGC